MSDNDPHKNEDTPTPKSRQAARYNWGQGVSISSMVAVVAIVGITALLLIALSMCSRTPAEEPPAESAGAGYGILERNVKAAFDSNKAERQDRSFDDEAGEALPVQSPASGSSQAQKASPQEQRQRAMEEQQDAIKTQEELRDRQRAQVPSILPENPPTPVPLGGNNY